MLRVWSRLWSFQIQKRLVAAHGHRVVRNPIRLQPRVDTQSASAVDRARPDVPWRPQYRALGAGAESSYRHAAWETRMAPLKRARGNAWLAARLENSWRTPS